MTTYFETKEQYLTFRKAWAKAVNDSRSKKTYVPIKETDEVFCGQKMAIEAHVVKGWLTAAHHLMFNLLSRRPYYTGFTPITNANKLRNGAFINHGLYFAVQELKRVVEYARNDISGKANKWQSNCLSEFCHPIVTYLPGDYAENYAAFAKVLASLELPEEKPLESNWGKSMKVARQIIEGEKKHITYDDIWNMMKEVA